MKVSQPSKLPTEHGLAWYSMLPCQIQGSRYVVTRSSSIHPVRSPRGIYGRDGTGRCLALVPTNIASVRLILVSNIDPSIPSRVLSSKLQVRTGIGRFSPAISDFSIYTGTTHVEIMSLSTHNLTTTKR